MSWVLAVSVRVSASQSKSSGAIEGVSLIKARYYRQGGAWQAVNIATGRRNVLDVVGYLASSRLRECNPSF